MHNAAISIAKNTLVQNPNDSYGWFNLGSSLAATGNFPEAAAAFDEARRIGLPWRMLWYQFAPYQAYLAVGRYDDVRLLADTTLFDDVYSEEAYFYKGQAYLMEGDKAAAVDFFGKALLYNAHYSDAQDALNSIQN
jgi:cytochrome c-type biogenesis protein CcmH/NrfG